MSKKSEEIQSRIIELQTAGNMAIDLWMKKRLSESVVNEFIKGIDECVENLKSRIK